MRYKQSIMVAALAVCFWYFWPSSNANIHRAVTATEAEDAHHDAVPSTPARSTVSPATISPFGKGAPILSDPLENIAALKKIIASAGIHVPARYHAMRYKKLKELADSGDIFAILQLGTQHLFLSDPMREDPDYDFSVPTKEEAYKLFSQAALKGSHAAMNMLATRLAEQNPVESYAWMLLARQLTEDGKRDFYRNAQYPFNLNAAEMQQATIRSQQLYEMILAQPPLEFPPE